VIPVPNNRSGEECVVIPSINFAVSQETLFFNKTKQWRYFLTIFCFPGGFSRHSLQGIVAMQWAYFSFSLAMVSDKRCYCEPKFSFHLTCFPAWALEFSERGEVFSWTLAIWPFNKSNRGMQALNHT
jgi:hypothetical protein